MSASDFPASVEVKIRVFDPNARGEAKQLVFDLPIGSSVGEMKRTLASKLNLQSEGTEHRSEGAVLSSLRLIYSGKLLQSDTAPLFSVFRKPNEEDSQETSKPSFALHAVLPLQKSTKDRYSHEVQRSSSSATSSSSRSQGGATRNGHTGNQTPNRVSSAPVTPHITSLPNPSPQRQDSADARLRHRRDAPVSPELAAARAAAGAAAARHRTNSATRARTDTMDDLSLGDSASSPGSSSVDPQTPQLEPRRPTSLPQHFLNTPQSIGHSPLAEVATTNSAQALERQLAVLRQQLGIQVPGQASSIGQSGLNTGSAPIGSPGVYPGGLLPQYHQPMSQQLPGQQALPPFNIGLTAAMGQAGGIIPPPGLFGQFGPPMSPMSHAISPGSPPPFGLPSHGQLQQPQYPPGLGFSPQMQAVQQQIQRLQLKIQLEQQQQQLRQRFPQPSLSHSPSPQTSRAVQQTPPMHQTFQGLAGPHARGQHNAQNNFGHEDRDFNADDQNAGQAAVQPNNDVRQQEDELPPAEPQDREAAAGIDLVLNDEDEGGEGGGQDAWGRLGLIAKIAFIIVILGQDGDVNRLTIMSIIGVLVFLWRDGWLNPIVQRFAPHRRPAAGIVDPAQAAAELRRLQERSIVVGGVSPTDPRRNCCTQRLLDLVYIVSSFFLAVLPWWRPQRNTHLDQYFADVEHSATQAEAAAGDTGPLGVANDAVEANAAAGAAGAAEGHLHQD